MVRREGSEQRVMLLEAWRDFETAHGDPDSQERVKRKLPKKVKKRRKIQLEDGSEGGWEEYWDYIFPEDDASAPGLKLLELAKQWKRRQLVSDSDSEESSGESDRESDSEQPKVLQHLDQDSSNSD